MIKKFTLTPIIELISSDQAEAICRKIITDLPDYFGIPSANEHYVNNIRSCKNLAAKVDDNYVGLLSLNFPFENNCQIFWMGVLRKFQSKGIGYQLINAAVGLGKQFKVGTMTVETLSPHESDENYLKTYQFYLSLGFKPLFFLKPEGYLWNMVYMVKNITDALPRLISLEKDSRAFGFDWPNITTVIEQAIDECNEILEAVENPENANHLQEEIGNLIHTAISLCIFEKFDVEDTLNKVIQKFAKRMTAVKELTQESGLVNLQGQSFEFMLELWKRAKIKE